MESCRRQQHSRPRVLLPALGVAVLLLLVLALPAARAFSFNPLQVGWGRGVQGEAGGGRACARGRGACWPQPVTGAARSRGQLQPGAGSVGRS